MIRLIPFFGDAPVRMIRVLYVMIFILTGLGMLSVPMANAQLVADLSENSVSIESDYNGTELLLFGAVDGDKGDDIIIVVTGPDTKIAQRRKNKVAGIWVNVETNIWTKAPSFYQILATRDLADIADADMLRALKVGATNLALPIVPETDPLITGLPVPVSANMIDKLSANMTELDLWGVRTGTIKLKEGVLFRTLIDLPSNVLSGAYDVRIIHMRDGTLMSEDNTVIIINKGGLSATIYNMAHHFSLFYGLFAVAFAIAAGWLAAIAFQRK